MATKKERREEARAGAPAPRGRAGGTRAAPADGPVGSAAAFLGARVVVVVLIVISQSGGGSAAAAARRPQTRSTQQLKGIPQHGTALGDPNAKAKIVEFGDLQCPVCRDFSEQVTPGS